MNNKIDIDEVLKLKNRINEINSFDLTKVKFIKDGKEINVDKEIIEDWGFIGLNNFDFIIMTDLKNAN